MRTKKEIQKKIDEMKLMDKAGFGSVAQENQISALKWVLEID